MSDGSNKTELAWTVKTGKLNNSERGAEVLFPSVSDAEWTKIRELAQNYAKIHLRSCPPVVISGSDKKLVFRLGHSAGKPVLIAESNNISSAECATYRDQLIAGAEIFHTQGLGFGLLDRRLLWKIDGAFLFVPAFWLPAFALVEMMQPGMPPEYVGGSTSSPSQAGDIYAIASFCFRALTGREYESSNPTLPGDIHSDLKGWDAVLDSALRKSPARRPISLQEWKASQPQQMALVYASAPLPPSIQTSPSPVSASSEPIPQSDPTTSTGSCKTLAEFEAEL